MHPVLSGLHISSSKSLAYLVATPDYKGLVKLLKKDSLKHGINVIITDNKITLEFHVIVAYGVSISAVSDNLISNVKYRVEDFTGLTIEKINILVEGVRVID